jgi:hypothetical protein
MPDNSNHRRKSFVHLAFVFFAGMWVTAAARALTRQPATESPCEAAPAPDKSDPVLALMSRVRETKPERTQPFRVRAAVATVFSVIFFAGAAMTAVAGDQVQQFVTGDSAQAVASSSDASAAGNDAAAAPSADQPSSDQPSADQPTADQPSADQPSSSDPTAEPAATGGSEYDPNVSVPEAAPAPTADPSASAPTDAAAPDASSDAAPAVSSSDAVNAAPTTTANVSSTSKQVRKVAPRAHPRPRALPKRVLRTRVQAMRVDDDVDASSGTVPQPYTSVTWLAGHMPTLSPPSFQMRRDVARKLVGISRAANVDWAFLFGVVETKTNTSLTRRSIPVARAIAPELGRLLAEGKDESAAAAAILQTSDAADRAVALSHYNRAVGTETLIQGVAASKDRLVQRVLNDKRIEIYDGGRMDLEAGLIDVRVAIVIAYLADTFNGVTVSCLVSGHRLYARPGVISAHVYGEAVDISAVGGTPIEGHQQEGSVTENAIRALLLLPRTLEPAQIISLLGLGGPSFPLADHYNHIHVGYSWLPTSSR